MDMYILSSISRSGEIPIAIGTNFDEALDAISSHFYPKRHFKRYIFRIGKAMYMLRKLHMTEIPTVVTISKLNKYTGSQSIIAVTTSEPNAYRFIKNFINIEIIATDDIDGTRVVIGESTGLSIDYGKNVYFVRSFVV